MCDTILAYAKTTSAAVTDAADSETLDCQDYRVVADVPCRVSCQPAVDGVAAVGSFTLSGCVAGDTAGIGDTTFTAVDTGTPTSIQFMVGEDDTESAVNLKNAINAHPVAGLLVQGVATTPEIDFVAVTKGSAGNAIELSVGALHIARSGATLTGGADITDETGIPVFASTPVTMRFALIGTADPVVSFIRVGSTSGTIVFTPVE